MLILSRGTRKHPCPPPCPAPSADATACNAPAAPTASAAPAAPRSIDLLEIATTNPSIGFESGAGLRIGHRAERDRNRFGKINGLASQAGRERTLDGNELWTRTTTEARVRDAADAPKNRSREGPPGHRGCRARA